MRIEEGKGGKRVRRWRPERLPVLHDWYGEARRPGLRGEIRKGEI